MERSKERKKGVRQEEEKERRERMGETEEISTEAVHSPGLFCKNVEKLCLSQKWQPTPRDITSYLAEWLSSHRTQVTNAGKDVVKENPYISYTLKKMTGFNSPKYFHFHFQEMIY